MGFPTLTGLLKSIAETFPDRRALSVSGKFDLSHSRLQHLVDSAASKLAAVGIKPGDVVALVFPNTVEFVIMFLAVIRARATAAPLNAAYTAEEFEFYLSDSEAKLLVTSIEGNGPAETAASKLKIQHVTASLPDAHDKLVLSLTQSNSNDSESDSVLEIINDGSDVALFLHTSGTTSRPKGVPLTQFNLASSVNNIKSVYKLTESDSTVIVLPLFHVHGLMAGLLSSLAAGAAVALPAAGRFSASTFWPDMIQYNATWYTAVPTIHQIILDRHSNKPEAIYPKLRFIRSCSASLAPSILNRLEEAFGAPVLEAYAMTEATHLMSSNPLPENGPHKAGSVGKPVGQEMVILDEKGVVQEANVKGEVCIKGSNVTKGYKSNPVANEEAFRYGWFHTGDIGYFDCDGYLHLVGRIKELINRGGEKISPIEVDAVLLAHPDVAQAVAFGVPDEKYGEEINCAIIPRGGSKIREEDVLSFCKKNLAAFKVPKKVFLTDSLPKTASGKIQRRIVAAHFLKANSASGMAVRDECKLKFLELKAKRNYRFIIFKIEQQEVVVEKLGKPDETYEDFTGSLPADECRYAVFDFDFITDENCQKSKIFFIAWSPDISKVRSKMVYASSKDRFKRELDGIQFELQATDPSEMSFDIVKARAF